MLMLSALPRATAFTNYRRRFQPRVVLRGMGMEQLGAVAAPGVRVRAPWKRPALPGPSHIGRGTYGVSSSTTVTSGRA